MSTSGPKPGNGPAPDVPLRYLLAAAAAFVLAAPGVVWLAPELAGHYYHPRVVALTHTVTLGWITLAIMGASYQLIPIVLPFLGWRWAFAVLAPGPAFGVWSMLRLRSLPEAAKIAQGRR